MPSIANAACDTRTRPDPKRSMLHSQIARRFVEADAEHVRITQFGRIYPGGSRYVSVTARRHGRRFALYFFHHGIDDWRTYPPRRVGPSIVYWSVDMAGEHISDARRSIALSSPSAPEYRASDRRKEAAICSRLLAASSSHADPLNAQADRSPSADPSSTDRHRRRMPLPAHRLPRSRFRRSSLCPGSPDDCARR